MRPIHDRLTTVLEPRDYAEYLAYSDRPPIHLLRVLSSDELRATRLEKRTLKLRSTLMADPQICPFRFGVITDVKRGPGFLMFATILKLELVLHE